jgi:LAO/AO transport system kinase
MELADLVVVNKSDGEQVDAAAVTASEYASALHLVRPRHPRWTPRVLQCSALLGEGIDTTWEAVEEFRVALGDELPALRSAQAREAMWSEVSDALLRAVRDDPRVAALTRTLQDEVTAGQITPGAAAETILEVFLTHGDADPRDRE